MLVDSEPRKVFYYFEQICDIPHGSYNIRKISDYLADFAASRGLKYHQDSLGNVIIYKAATKGYEDKPTIVIQGHMDMVAVKTKDSNKDLEAEGLDLRCDGQYLWADKTSLGADDGIALAMALAILDDEELPHPSLECVFTVNEEVGMDGAIGLDKSLIKGRMLLNIDSEEEGILTVGCAGGQRVEFSYPYTKEFYKGTKLLVKVDGLLGGHSGTMIHLQRANANVLMGRVLDRLSSSFSIGLISVDGGEKCNAICLLSEAYLVIEDYDKSLIDKLIGDINAELVNEYAVTDPDICISYQECGLGSFEGMDAKAKDAVIGILQAVPDGVIDYNKSIEGLVETSLNVGVVKTSDERFDSFYELRSSAGSKINYLARRVALIGSSFGASVKLAEAYPEWEYNRSSVLSERLPKLYSQMFGTDMKVEVIHAGLECGVLSKGLPGLDAVSFGPNILDIHTVNEKLDIESTKRVYSFLKRILEEI